MLELVRNIICFIWSKEYKKSNRFFFNSQVRLILDCAFMKKYTKWLTRSILISIFSIAVVLIFTLDTNTIKVVREIRPGYILAALVIHLFSFVVWGLRIKSMTSALGHKVGLIRSFEIVVSGTFVAALTPSSIGGEPLRIHYSGKIMYQLERQLQLFWVNAYLMLY